MAGRPRNMDYTVQGGTITLDAYFYDFSGGILTDPDTPPTYTIYDPHDVVMATGTGIRISTGYYTASYTTSSTAEISDFWKIVWSATVNGSPVEDAWEYWRVVSSGSIYFGSVICDEETINLIKKRIAYPSADQIILDNEEIKTYIVRQALDEYFTKFPLKSDSIYSINQEAVIDFPDSNTFGAIDVRIVGKGYTSITSGSFWDLVAYQSIGGINLNRSGMYGTKMRGYNPNSLRQMRFMNQMVNDTLVNQGTYKYRIDLENRKLYAFSSMNATLNVTWAKRSLDFSNVKFQHKWDVIKLAQGYLMQHVADTVGMINDSAQEVTINVDMLKEEAKEQIQSIKEKWMEYSDVVILRQ